MKVTLPSPGSLWAPSLPVDNRLDFSDLSEVAFSWRIIESGANGIGSASGGPHTAGNVLTLQGLPTPLSGTMQLNATSARGFLLNSWSFPLSAPSPSPSPNPPKPAPGVVELPDGTLSIADAAGTFSWSVGADGSVTGNTTAAGQLVSGGPSLMVLPLNSEGGTQLYEGMPPILPFNDVLEGWVLHNRTAAIVGNDVVVTLLCSYEGSASGSYALVFDGGGRLTVSYSFTWTGAAVSPRQVGLSFSGWLGCGAPPPLTPLLPPQVGVVMNAPADLAVASWRRVVPWQTDYPSDHIGRPAGDGVPANVGPAPGVNSSRAGPWANDPSPIGDADFRSTRHNVSVFQLGVGARALAFLSANSSQHARVWVASDGSVGILAADLSNEGDNSFGLPLDVLPRPTYSAGAVLEGAATFQLGGTLSSARR